jgi:hypothetical protein
VAVMIEPNLRRPARGDALDQRCRDALHSLRRRSSLHIHVALRPRPAARMCGRAGTRHSIGHLSGPLAR